MKKLFYLGILGLLIFEVAKVYFIMPIPGSQEVNSISLAYFLHSYRLIIRIVFGLMILIGLKSSWKGSFILVILSLALAGVLVFMTNFKMVADHMFYQPKNLILLSAAENKVGLEKLIIGVDFNNETRAYPIQFIGFHHQVRDSMGGTPIIATYCTVCRTGRVFASIVNGKTETFRLVGMDHYNAMFEDKTTKSWWRQETGEAVAGPLRGERLYELPSSQATLKEWLTLHPESLIMQPDTTYQSDYDSLANYEGGKRDGRLTRRDTASWQDKSWVAGIIWKQDAKAYDWNLLLKKQIINDVISAHPIVIFLADDHLSLFAFKRTSSDQQFFIRNDTLSDGINTYNFLGHSYQENVKGLQRIQAYQEYWHSWRFFHPGTQQYQVNMEDKKDL